MKACSRLAAKVLTTMPDKISLTFLGTAAGRPCPTRNVSSLAIKIDRAVWVVDAGEGTQHQFMNSRCQLKMSQVTKIFVTHMHADHIMGLPGLLCTISAGEGGVLPDVEDPRIAAASATSARPTDLYGPKGLRAFVRQSLASTFSILTRPYIVHELLFPGEEPSPSPSEGLWPSERQGRDIPQVNGVWSNFEEAIEIDISAGPILHTVPCIGYIFSERPRPLPLVPSDYIAHLLRPANADALALQGIRNPRILLGTLTRNREPITLADGTILYPPEIGGPGRKIVVLGDTYDASGCAGLALGADLVVHESTNAFLPALDEAQRKPGVTIESVRETAKSHGHSTPEVAGGFARSVGARGLALNHLSVKYPSVALEEEESDSLATKLKRACLVEIGRLASEAWGGGIATVASDFLAIELQGRTRAELEESSGKLSPY